PAVRRRSGVLRPGRVPGRPGGRGVAFFVWTSGDSENDFALPPAALRVPILSIFFRMSRTGRRGTFSMARLLVWRADARRREDQGKEAARAEAAVYGQLGIMPHGHMLGDGQAQPR